MAVEVPVAAPVSLGQFMHANLTPWDWMPYRSVGNSFPSMVVPLDKSWTHGTPHTNAGTIGGHTFGDMSYLMNNALWDSFFFSGAAPILSDGSRTGNYNAVRAKTLSQVMTDFAAGTGKLANPRMTLFPNDSASANALLANGFLTLSSNLTTGLRVHDMECCYKLFTISAMRLIIADLSEERFGIEPQMIAVAARHRLRVCEVGVSYTPRGFRDGKKIRFKDGLRVFVVLWRESRTTARGKRSAS